jgi:hypothetical protein
MTDALKLFRPCHVKGDLVKVRDLHALRKRLPSICNKLAIVVSDHYHSGYAKGVLVDVMIDGETYSVKPFELERVNND